jgi:predicted RNA methylase
MKITSEILQILSSAEVEGNCLRLTCGQLDRRRYEATNKVLVAMGGKWSRKAGGHVFPESPEARLYDALSTGEVVSQQQEWGCYFTPPEIVGEVIRAARLSPGQSVLEPSAGQGALALAAAEIVGTSAILCVEILPENVNVLIRKGFGRVIQGDFLGFSWTAIYDRVIMNPPFSGQKDIDHVLHAWQALKPGGRLVAIMSAGWTFRSNRKSQEFRALVETNGSWRTLPEGSFRESGTEVSAVMVEMEKAGGDLH